MKQMAIILLIIGVGYIAAAIYLFSKKEQPNVSNHKPITQKEEKHIQTELSNTEKGRLF